jgi:hypothetical protein
MTWAMMVGEYDGRQRATTWVMMWAMMWATGAMVATTPMTMPAMTPVKGIAGTPARRRREAPGVGRGGGIGSSGNGGRGGCILQGSLLFIVKILFWKNLPITPPHHLCIFICRYQKL